MQKLNLNKPLCFFDLETTGIDVVKDRIVEISILKVYPSSEKESKTWLVNPEMPIPEASSIVHGITNKDVENQPTFKEISNEVVNMISGSDIAGFNSNRFDIPLLAEELMRAGQDIDLKKCRPIDVQVIFHKLEKRDLTAAYKFYCNKDLTNAHSAEADTLATYEILMAQIEKYNDLENDVKFLSDFSKHYTNADFAGFIGYDENQDEIFKFGKYKDKRVIDVLEVDSGYYNWIQNANFPLYTKRILTAIQLKILSQR